MELGPYANIDIEEEKARLRHIMKEGNWVGLPPANLFRSQVYFLLHEFNKFADVIWYEKIHQCPKCEKTLKYYESDWCDKRKDFVVFGKYCEEGHFTILDTQ